MSLARNWSAIAHNGDNEGGTFIALAATQTLARSVDSGMTWTEINLPNSRSWSSIAYGNGVWIVGSHTAYIARSVDDGLTWTEVNAGGCNSLIAYGNGAWVSSSTSWATSSRRSLDGGLNWVAASLTSPSANMYDLKFHEGVFLAVSLYGVYRSINNGETWQYYAFDTSGRPSEPRIAYTAGVFIITCAASAANNYVYRSIDMGITWARINLTYMVSGIYAPVGANGIFVLLLGGTVTSSRGKRSVDGGLTWEEIALPAALDIRSVAYGEGRFVAAGYNTNIAVRTIPAPIT